LRSSFFRLIRKLVQEGKVGPGLSFHGLRHTLGTALAEAGCDTPTIAAVLGQATTAMAEHYSKNAKRKHLVGAAIDRIEERDRNEERKTGGKPASN
jgi:integrase